MQIYVTTSDGETYHAENALDFVRQLKDSSMAGQGMSLNQFMRETAKRASQETGFAIKSHNASRFVEGLLKAGLVKEQAKAA